LQRCSDPITVFRQPTSKGRGGKKRGGEMKGGSSSFALGKKEQSAPMRGNLADVDPPPTAAFSQKAAIQ